MNKALDRVQDAKIRAMKAEHDRQQRWRDAPAVPIRHPAGRRKSQAPRRDRGTDQLREKRRQAAGHESVPHDYPLAVLAARGKITDAQAEAGKTLAGMRAILLGLPFPPAAQWASLVALGVVPDERPTAALDSVAWENRYCRVRSAYDAAIALLDATGISGAATRGEPRSTAVVVKVAVFDEAPRRTEVRLLQAGLHALAVEWKMERR